MPLAYAQKPIAWRLDKTHIETLQVSRHNIHEIRRIEKYRGTVLFEDRGELCVKRVARLRIARRTCLREKRIGLRIRIEGKIQTRVSALFRFPEGIEVELPADSLARTRRSGTP